MRDRTTVVLHIVADDTPPQRLQLVRALVEASESRGQRVLALGALPPGIPRGMALRAPLEHPLAASFVQRTLGGRWAAPIVHTWSPRAARWACAAFARAPAEVRLLCDMVQPFDAIACAKLLRRRAARPVELTCEDAASAARLADAGFAPGDTRVASSVCSLANLAPAERSRRRHAWGAKDDAPVVIILPPVSPGSGAFTATWGALVAQRVHTRLRILLPGRGAEVSRILRTADATGQTHVMRPAGDAPLAELLAIADIAVYLPPGEMTSYALEAAARCDLAIVASPTHANRGAVAQAGGVTWCIANDRAEASRAILDAVDAHPSRARTATPPATLESPIATLKAIYGRRAAQT